MKFLLPRMGLERLSRSMKCWMIGERLCCWTRCQRVSSRDILDTLSVTGGIPRYLEEVKCSLKFKCADGCAVRAALVYDGELAETIPADGYFDAIVSFRRLLGI